MRLKDARHLSTKAQEALRYRVVDAVDREMSKTEAAQLAQQEGARIYYSRMRIIWDWHSKNYFLLFKTS